VTIPQFAAAEGNRLLQRHAPPKNAAQGQTQRAAILEGLNTCLFGGSPPVANQPALVQAASAEQVGTMTFQPEPGVTLTARQEPTSPAAKKLAVVLDLDGGEKASASPLAARLRNGGWSVLTLDLRATGKLAPPNDRIGRAPDHNTAEWSLWLGRPLLGQWVIDVRRLLDALQERDGRLPDEILVAGIGPAGVVAIGSAAVDSRISRVAAMGVLASYVTREPYQGQRLGILVPGILRDAGDIPHLAALVAPRPVVIAGGVTGGGPSLDADSLEAAFAFTRQAYAVQDAPDRFRLVVEADPDRLVEQIQ
jgi:hypothetical protein